MSDETNLDSVNNHRNYPELQEYPFNFNFLKLIPSHAQKGISTFDLELTCIDADGHFIVIGSNIGIVYLYDRRKQQLSRLRNEHKDPITTVKILLSLECLVLCGSKNGAVALFKVPFDASEQIEKFSVDGFHNSPITALEWAKSGFKFYSGDENGIIVCTEIDYSEHQSRSRILLNEQSKIVQLSHYKEKLVVSTLFRSLIYCCEINSIFNIGQKERKCYGPFGAIVTSLTNSTEGTIFASRPGQRLWKSNTQGIIEETMIFKSAISEPHSMIRLQNEDTKLWNLSDFQFGLLNSYLDKYIVISSDTAIVLIDPDQKSIVASCPKLYPVVDVCTANDEIFILRELRSVIRISPFPDPYVCEKDPVEPSLIEDLLVPFKELSTFVKERSDSLSIQKEKNLFGWLRKKRSASAPSPLIESEVNLAENISNNSQTLPQVIKLNTEELMPVVIDELPQPPILPIIKISNTEDEIVYRRKKKHKNKKVRFRSKSPSKDRKSLELQKSDETDSANIAEKEKSDDMISVDENTNTLKLSKSEEKDLETTSDSSAPSVDSNSRSVFFSDQNILDKKLQSTVSISSDDNQNNNVINENNESKLVPNSDDLPIPTSEDNNDSTAVSPACEDDVNNKISNNENQQNKNDPDDIYLSFSSSNVQNTTECEVDSSSVSEELSLASTDESEAYVPPKYGADWIEYKAPEVLLDLSISNYHIYCVDIKNQLYISHYPVLGMHWIELSQPADKLAVSPSDTIVWVLYNGTVYAAVQKSTIKWKEVEWVSFARDVKSIAVEDDCGWYVTESGQLIMHPNITASRPYSYPETIEMKYSLLQVTCHEGIVWVLNSGGCVYGCTPKAKDIKSKSQWQKVEFEENVEVNYICLGSQHTAWIVDSTGIIKLILGVTPESLTGTGKPFEVETSRYLMINPSQFQKTIMKALNNETFSFLIKGQQQICLSTSTQGVWFCKTLDNTVYANQRGVIGHLWDPFVPVGTATLSKWNFLAAGGLTSSEESIWCVNATGEIFCCILTTKTLVTVESPSVNGIKCLVPSIQSLWLLSEDGSLYVRRGITSNCLQGVWWQNLDLNQLGSEKITHVSCSPNASWACSSEGRILIRLGTLCPSSDRKLPQAWIPLSNETEINASTFVDTFSLIGKRFPLPLMPQSTAEIFFLKVYVGPLGYPVWAIDSKRDVYVREGVTNNFPIGTKWTSVPELKAKELCVSKYAVWLLKDSGKIFRRFGISEKNPCGDYWKQIPGNMDSLSVALNDDLWGMKDNIMFCHSSFVLNYESKEDSKKSAIRSISEEDDWEDILCDAADDEA